VHGKRALKQGLPIIRKSCDLATVNRAFRIGCRNVVDNSNRVVPAISQSCISFLSSIISDPFLSITNFINHPLNHQHYLLGSSYQFKISLHHYHPKVDSSYPQQSPYSSTVDRMATRALLFLMLVAPLAVSSPAPADIPCRDKNGIQQCVESAPKDLLKCHALEKASQKMAPDCACNGKALYSGCYCSYCLGEVSMAL
jgi:hypothetical protein